MSIYKNIISITLLGALGLTSACSTFSGSSFSGSDFDPDTIIPEQNPALNMATWSEEVASTLPSTNWVSGFGSDQLNQLVEEALNANPDVQGALARLDASRAAATSARAPLFPNINGSVNANQTRFENDFQPNDTSYSAGPSLSWELDVWGRVRDGAKVGELDVVASMADYAGARVSIAGATANAWFDLIESKLLLGLAEKDVETRSRAASLTERRFNGGLSPSSDVRLARSSAANAKAILASRKQLNAASARQLEILLRRYPSAQITSPADLPDLPALTGAGTPLDIYAKRPDIIAAANRLSASGLQVDIAKKNLLPQLSLNADATLRNRSFDDLFDLDNLVSTLLGNVAGPIFNAGARRADVQRNEALLRQQVESYVSTALNAYFEVESALNAEIHLLERERALRVSLEEAQQAESRLLRRYGEGLATILQLLDAQSRAIDAESQLIGARSERLSNRVRLHLALGGGDIANIDSTVTDNENQR